MRVWWSVTAVAFLAAGCGGDESLDPIVPDDWETALVEARDCRLSVEHELEYVRLFISPEWAAHFDACVEADSGCTEPFGEGALLVKPQYADADCTDLLRVTASLRETAAAAPGPDGWRWQEVTADGRVVLDGAPASCTHCHTLCEGSYDLRCAMDP
jgi:hypothetical protein